MNELDSVVSLVVGDGAVSVARTLILRAHAGQGHGAPGGIGNRPDERGGAGDLRVGSRDHQCGNQRAKTKAMHVVPPKVGVGTNSTPLVVQAVSARLTEIRENRGQTPISPCTQLIPGEPTA